MGIATISTCWKRTCKSRTVSLSHLGQFAKLPWSHCGFGSGVCVSVFFLGVVFVFVFFVCFVFVV